MEIDIPNVAHGERPSTGALLKSILDYDQFDDWLVDPIYYEDKRFFEARVVAKLDQLWQTRKLSAQPLELMTLPRSEKSPQSPPRDNTVPALALPLAARVLARGVIAAMASRLDFIPPDNKPREQGLPRDKVYGFLFQKNEPGLFSEPGAELIKAYDNAFEVARKGDDYLEVLDINAFNRSATVDRLARVLQDGGARPDEVAFLRQVIGQPAQGLPSIDNAFAYIYNFYLQPVDRALVKSQTNFFRYRDEYFVFNESVKQVINSELSKLGLTSKLLHRFTAGDFGGCPSGGLEEYIYLLEKDGWEWGINCTCDSDDSTNKDCSDLSEEFVYKSTEPDSMKAFFSQIGNGARPDAIRILPLLRVIHKRRRSGVLAPPPAGDREFSAYKGMVVAGRAKLADAVTAGLNAGAEWQLTWAIPILSDVGSLNQPEQTLMLAVINKPGIPQAAKAAARLALARSSTLPVSNFWADPDGSSTEHQARSALLAARYLFKRGDPAPWNRLAQQPNVDSELKDFLIAKISGGRN